jgi:hypothetical protein
MPFVRLAAWRTAEENRPAEEKGSEMATFLPSSTELPSKFDFWPGRALSCQAAPPSGRAPPWRTWLPRHA